MAAPDYSMIDSSIGVPPEGDAGASADPSASGAVKLSATEKLLAQKFGFSDEQASGLKEFIQECMESQDYDAAQDAGE